MPIFLKVVYKQRKISYIQKRSLKKNAGDNVPMLSVKMMMTGLKEKIDATNNEY